MGNKIICIGREFGSGGHQIALLLGQKLGLKVYEKDILHMACKYGDLQVSRMEPSDEKATNPYLFETVHPQWFAKDGVHPNNDGAAAIAQAVYEAIK